VTCVRGWGHSVCPLVVIALHHDQCGYCAASHDMRRVIDLAAGTGGMDRKAPDVQYRHQGQHGVLVLLLDVRMPYTASAALLQSHRTLRVCTQHSCSWQGFPWLIVHTLPGSPLHSVM
jgi:hypothetical protein